MEQLKDAAAKPLSVLRILEFSGLGPAPFAAMLLADMGARVTRILSPGDAGRGAAKGAFLNRGRDDVVLDLKTEEGLEAAHHLIRDADALIEGFRPGKMEQLGLGPATVMPLNPRLVYGRMTGWGQEGPMAHLAGHDLNFLGLTGLLSMMGEKGRCPMPPLNLISDFGGGGMYLAFGLLCAIWQARTTGQGQVVDAAMIHGTTHLATFIHSRRAQGHWIDERECNMVDGGAPFYRAYETRDGRYVVVGAIEPIFFRNLIRTLQLNDRYVSGQNDLAQWPELANLLGAKFLEQDLEYWTELFKKIDACVTPVLTVEEAQKHPQMVGCFQEIDGYIQPIPAPRILPWRGIGDDVT
ncbi:MULTISPECIES: CaiB/BaiF CoA transferase family protein [Alphaproteobacteria]|uniref:CoA transferase n=2 Tax=Alphaproteobacteria TaxID=28211 RepID=A0A512HNL3_9HYPH|nr:MULTISPECIES: CaiB/BaiF CoA-transferase family protein [Alphaproteobacteria]GEO87048.1 CoA transferase [Ciceribacter naphthalenivorans]GLR23166.1 CoA transferase [Ciceribacter naphthalenivorans]GLT06022.1 CoA transferase [Sphingomonas psychrolutea]